MRVTLLGHASVLVELEGVRCLMDPVFQDPFQEGALVSCPKREVDADALGPLDVLLLTRAHLDHFDIPTLARLPRTVDVICPKDHAIAYVLQQLGYTNVHPTEAMSLVPYKGTQLLMSRSHVAHAMEFGVIFKDRSGAFWNQVDTVLAPDTIQASLDQAGRIDLLFSMYASQSFDFFEGRSSGFPHATHAMNLSNVLAIRPKMVVPASAGFRFDGPFAWSNAFLFPVSRELFIEDLARLDPEIGATVADPGDVFEIEGGEVRRLPGASALARTVEEDTSLLAYDPTSSIPPLADPNPDGYSSDKIAKAVDACFDGLTSFVVASYTKPDPVIDEHRQHGATYAVAVVMPDGGARWLRVELGALLPSFTTGTGPMPAAAVVHRIAGSALAAWTLREKSYFYFRGFSRKFSTFHVVAQRDGKVVVEPRPLPDLLGHYLLRKAPGADMALKQRLDLQLRPYLGAAAARV